MEKARTWIPLEQGLILPDFPCALAQHSRAFSALGQFASCTATFVDHCTRHVDTLLSENAYIVFVGVGWYWGCMR